MNKIRDSYQEVSSLYFDIVLSGINYDKFSNVKTTRNGADFTITGTDYKIVTDVNNDKIYTYCCDDDFKQAYDSDESIGLLFEAIDTIKLEIYKKIIRKTYNISRGRGHDADGFPMWIA